MAITMGLRWYGERNEIESFCSRVTYHYAGRGPRQAARRGQYGVDTQKAWDRWDWGELLGLRGATHRHGPLRLLN